MLSCIVNVIKGLLVRCVSMNTQPAARKASLSIIVSITPFVTKLEKRGLASVILTVHLVSEKCG